MRLVLILAAALLVLGCAPGPYCSEELGVAVCGVEPCGATCAVAVCGDVWAARCTPGALAAGVQGAVACTHRDSPGVARCDDPAQAAHCVEVACDDEWHGPAVD